jgi:hypothetical protein
MISPLNPWFLLALLGGLLGTGFVAYEAGEGNGAARVQSAWDEADRIAIEARAARITENRKIEAGLQAAADADRRKRDAEKTRLDDRLRAALERLRDRPSRPSSAGGGLPAASGPGSFGACTGAGLYRDDGEFLARRAAAYQLIRIDRDECRRRYEAAQKAVAGAGQ